MLGHGCGVSQYNQFYDKNKNLYQMFSRPYVGSYSGEKGRQFLQYIRILSIEKSVEIFVTISISDMPTIKYWQNLGTFMDTSKENIPK